MYSGFPQMDVSTKSIFKNALSDKSLFIIVFTGFTLKLGFSVYSVFKGVNYFEYGIILNNIFSGNGYSYTFNYFSNPVTVSSAYMPPGYVLFLSPFFIFNNTLFKDFTIFLVQNILSCFSVYLLFTLTLKYFSRKTTLITATLFSLLPDFIYISNTITPTTLFHFLFLILLFILLKEDNNDIKNINAILAGLLTGAISLIRGEFLLFASIIFIYFLYKRNYRFITFFSLLIILVLAPWILRNYIVFDSFVPSSTNFGLNFYRGHNIYEIGDWGDEKILAELNKIEANSNFEIKMSQIFLNRSLEMIQENPSFELMNSIKKIFHLWIISPVGFQNSYYPALFLWILLLPFIFVGLIKSFSVKKFKFIYFFIIYFNIIAILFFVLIRYQIMFKPLLLPFGAYGIIIFAKSMMKKIDN